MSYQVKPGSVFGRLGGGLGEALSEMVPQEVQRYRLSKGLGEIAAQKDKTPFEQFAALSGLPGITPQMLQSATELLKQQSMRQAFQRKAGQVGGEEAGQIAEPTQLAQLGQAGMGLPERAGGQNIPGMASSAASMAGDIPGKGRVPGENPLLATPGRPWNQKRWESEIAIAQNEFPNMTFPEIREYVEAKQQRELLQPQAEQARNEYIENAKQRTNTKFESSLQKKLGKELILSPKEGQVSAYSDISGEQLEKVKMAMYRELAQNPNMNEDDLADKYSGLVLDMAKSLNTLKTDAQKSFFSKTPSQVIENAKVGSKIYRSLDNSEDYQKELESNFGWSPERAAQIAFPLSKPVKGLVESIGRSPADPKRIPEISTKRAYDLVNKITPSDSIQAIARTIKDKDPYFDENAFFSVLREIVESESSPFNPRQKLEIQKGTQNFLPNWNDIWYFPWTTGVESKPSKQIKMER